MSRPRSALNTDVLSEGKICLTPECGKAARWKGLCTSCYGCAKNLIDLGETTWEELSELDLALLPKNLLKKEFYKRKKERDQSDNNQTNVSLKSRGPNQTQVPSLGNT